MTLIKQYDLHDRHINEQLQHLKPASIPLCTDVQTMKTIVQDYLRGKLSDNYT